MYSTVPVSGGGVVVCSHILCRGICVAIACLESQSSSMKGCSTFELHIYLMICKAIKRTLFAMCVEHYSILCGTLCVEWEQVRRKSTTLCLVISFDHTHKLIHAFASTHT